MTQDHQPEAVTCSQNRDGGDIASQLYRIELPEHPLARSQKQIVMTSDKDARLARDLIHNHAETRATQIPNQLIARGEDGVIVP